MDFSNIRWHADGCGQLPPQVLEYHNHAFEQKVNLTKEIHGAAHADQGSLQVGTLGR